MYLPSIFFYNFKRLKATSKNHMQPKCQFSFRSKKREILTVFNGPCIIDFSRKVRQRTRNTIWVLKEIWVKQFAKNQRICVQTTYEFYDLKKNSKNHQKLSNLILTLRRTRSSSWKLEGSFLQADRLPLIPLQRTMYNVVHFLQLIYTIDKIDVFHFVKFENLITIVGQYCHSYGLNALN